MTKYHKVVTSTTQYWPSNTKYWPLPPYTDPVPPSRNHFHLIMTHYCQVLMKAIQYWPSITKYRSIPPNYDPVPPSTDQYHPILTQYYQVLTSTSKNPEFRKVNVKYASRKWQLCRVPLQRGPYRGSQWHIWIRSMKNMQSLNQTFCHWLWSMTKMQVTESKSDPVCF